MNKIGIPTYLGNKKESLRVADDKIEGGNVIPLYSNSMFDQLQLVIKTVKLWCGDNEIIKNFTPQVFPPGRQGFQ